MQSILSIFAMKQGVSVNSNNQKLGNTVTEELQNALQKEKTVTTNSLKESNAKTIIKCAESGDNKDSATVIVSENNRTSSSKDSVEKPTGETRTRAHYKKRLYAAAQNAEKLFSYCKAIKSDNKEQKEQVNSVLEKVGEFSEKVKSLTEKTSKMKEDFEKKEKSQFSGETLPKKLSKAKNPAHFRVKAAVERNLSANSVSRTSNEEKVLKNINFERKACRQHGRINLSKKKGDSIGRAQNNQDSIENEINELRRYFTELKNSVQMDKSGTSVSIFKSCADASNTEKMVKVISELICKTTTKIFDKMLSEDFEKIKKYIDEINRSWALESIHQKENGRIELKPSNVMVAKTLADQIQRIQVQIDQISNTYNLLNAQVSQQRQDIIDLNGRLREMLSQKYDDETERTADLYSSPIQLSQSYSNPDFVIAQILRSVEDIAVKIKNEHKDADGKSGGKMKNDTSASKNADFETLQAKIMTSRKNSSNSALQRENFFRRLKMSNGSVPYSDTKTPFSSKRSPTLKNSQFKRTKRNFNSRTAGVKTASLVMQSKPPQILNAPNTKSVSARCSSVSSPEKNQRYTKPSPLLSLKTNYLSDVISKEIDRRIPELIRVNRIPKLLDEIASSVEPFTLSCQSSKSNCQKHQEREKNSSLIGKNIFTNSTTRKQIRTRNRNADKSEDLSNKKKLETEGQQQIAVLKTMDSQANILEKKKKLQSSRASSRKKSLDLYSREFLTSVKKSFVKIVSNEIRKSISDLVTSKNSDEVNVTSVSSLRPMRGSKSLEMINPEGFCFTSDNISNTSKMTSQITFECVQKFIAAVSGEKNQKDNLSSINYEGLRAMSNSEQNLNIKLVTNQAEYFSQKFKMTVVPNIYGVLPGVENFNGLLRGTKLILAEKADDFNMEKSGNCVCRESKPK